MVLKTKGNSKGVPWGPQLESCSLCLPLIEVLQFVLATYTNHTNCPYRLQLLSGSLLHHLLECVLGLFFTSILILRWHEHCRVCCFLVAGWGGLELFSVGWRRNFISFSLVGFYSRLELLWGLALVIIASFVRSSPFFMMYLGNAPLAS